MKLPPLHGFYEWVFSGFHTNTVSRRTQTTGVLASWKTISCWKSKQDVTYVKAQKHPSELKYVLGGDHRAHRAWVFAARRYDCPEHSWFCLFMCLEILCNLCELMQLITSSPYSSSEAANTLGADWEPFRYTWSVYRFRHFAYGALQHPPSIWSGHHSALACNRNAVWCDNCRATWLQVPLPPFCDISAISQVTLPLQF
jgi:hypothetical protein